MMKVVLLVLFDGCQVMQYKRAREAINSGPIVDGGFKVVIVAEVKDDHAHPLFRVLFENAWVGDG